MLNSIEMLAMRINGLQQKVVVVFGEDVYGGFTHVVHMYNEKGVDTRRFYSQDDAEEFLLGILTALNTMR